MKALLILFAATTIFGSFLMVAGMAASHGHFRFRPHMAQDWFIFGAPLLGILGLVFVTIRTFRNRH